MPPKDCYGSNRYVLCSLEQFDQREQEAALPRDIPAFLNRIRAELA